MPRFCAEDVVEVMGEAFGVPGMTNLLNIVRV
jgi:hypothetical protein